MGIGFKFMAKDILGFSMVYKKTYKLGFEKKPVFQYSKYLKLESIGLQRQYYIIEYIRRKNEKDDIKLSYRICDGCDYIYSAGFC